MTREVGSARRPVADRSEATERVSCWSPRLEVDGKEFLAWEEAIEREVARPRIAGRGIVGRGPR